MMRGGNFEQSAAPNPAIPLGFHAGRQVRGVGEPRRSALTA